MKVYHQTYNVTGPLCESFENFIRFSNSAHPFKYEVNCCVMLFIRSGSHRVLSKNLLKSILVGKSCCAFDTKISRNPTEHYCIHPSTTQLKFKIGPIKCTPLLFVDNDIFWSRCYFRYEFSPVLGQ